MTKPPLSAASSMPVMRRLDAMPKSVPRFSGGAICHINVEQRVDDPQLIVDLMKAAAKQGVVYWAINYALHRCVNEHLTVGKGATCQICGAEITDTYTRVVGFLVNTKNWHKVRRDFDYPNRQFYEGI